LFRDHLRSFLYSYTPIAMADSSPAPAAYRLETTFRAYSQAQGTNYAENRPRYHPKLYQAILDYHTSNGGQLNTILDVGCGPGIVAQALAPHFHHAIGLDPSAGMISTAQSTGGVSSTSEPIRWEISTAEDLGSELSPPIQAGSVDLITAATAAHWFDMSRFWPRAAEVLKPGGTVALWTNGYARIHPSVPNYAAVQAALDQHKELLRDYIVPGNVLGNGLYADLPLPWTLATPVPEFDETTFFRKEAHAGNTPDSRLEFFVGLEQGVSLDVFERTMGTASAVTRWREAHPDAVGTEGDVVRVIRRNIERSLHEAGVEKGKEIINADTEAVLLMVKKKA